MKINQKILNLGINAKKASNLLSSISGRQKNAGIEELKKNLKKFSEDLITVNKVDIKNAHNNKISSAMIDRLTLNVDRIQDMIKSLDEIIMRPHDSLTLEPFKIHRMEAVEDAVYLEASTPELDDVIRLQDEYGREGTSEA